MLAATPVGNSRMNPVYINNQKFAVAVTVNGILAVSVDDFAKALGGTTNLQEAGLRMQGTQLWLIAPTPQTTAARDLQSGLPTGKRMHKPFIIRKNYDVCPSVIGYQGKVYVPVANIAQAFGGTLQVNRNTLHANEPIVLSFPPNPNAAIVANP